MLISSPARAWEEIRLEEDRRTVLTDFVYPMIGLCGLSVFIGSLFSRQPGWNGSQSFQYAMTQCCAVAVALFGGYFLAAYLINLYRTRYLQMEDDLPLARQFAGYALVVTFLLQLILGLLPDFRIVALLIQFYLVYVVWEGVPRLMGVNEQERLPFTIVTSLLLLGCPALIHWTFDKLTYYLN